MDTQQPAPTPAPAPAGGGKNTTMAIIAYFLFFVPLLTDAKNDPFVKFHVKQSLGLLLTWVVWNIVTSYIFLFGLEILVSLAFLILWIMGLVKAAQGKQEALPVVGSFYEKLNF
jgi:uncharacterized membrane protein